MVRLSVEKGSTAPITAPSRQKVSFWMSSYELDITARNIMPPNRTGMTATTSMKLSGVHDPVFPAAAISPSSHW